jgi:flagellar biosynthetic protein FliR
VKVAAPLLAGLLLINVATGIVARSAPSLNIFVLDIPLKIVFGFFGLIVILPFFAATFSEFLDGAWFDIGKLLTLL